MTSFFLILISFVAGYFAGYRSRAIKTLLAPVVRQLDQAIEKEQTVSPRLKMLKKKVPQKPNKI